MPQTFYVAQDEEILSVISRLRSSALLENAFVVPKRALILQSTVNLRLLAREAEKLGKRLFIVTQDEQGRALAEKLGIPTKPYSDDMRTHGNTAAQGESEVAKEASKSPSSFPNETSIGSSDFFSGSEHSSKEIDLSQHAENRPSPDVASPIRNIEMKVRVRDSTPKRLTTLNSIPEKDTSERMSSMSRTFPNGGEHIQQPIGNAVRVGTVPQSREPLPPARPLAERPPTGSPASGTQGFSREAIPPSPVDERLKHLYAERRGSDTREIPKQDVSLEAKGRGWIYFFVAVSLLSALGTAAYLFLPKAEIIITPQSRSENVNITFDGKIGGGEGSSTIPVRLFEREDETALTIDTTGASLANDSKAKGIVILYNEYSKDPQSLVATTRLESSEGKIFRLVKSVTIPGTANIGGDEVPGAIEAEVMADQAGPDYNIPQTTFTIPGFKGGSKYDKFSAKSKDAFSGGGTVSGTDSKGSTVSTNDLENGKKSALEKFRSSFQEALTGSLQAGEKFLPESVEVTPVGGATHPIIGIAATSFEYQSKFKGQTFIFSEAEVKEKAMVILKEKLGDVAKSLKSENVSILYSEAVPDFDKGILSLKTVVSVTLVSDIDSEKILGELLGKGGDEVKAVMDRYPEVKKIEVNIKPQYLAVFSIPKDKNRVTVTVRKE